MPLIIILMDGDGAAASAAAASAPPPPRPGQVLLQRHRSTWIGWRREGGPAAPALSVSGARGEARAHEQRTATHTHQPTHTDLRLAVERCGGEGRQQAGLDSLSWSLSGLAHVFFSRLQRHRVSRLQVTLAHLCGGTQADLNATPSC